MLLITDGGDDDRLSGQSALFLAPLDDDDDVDDDILLQKLYIFLYRYLLSFYTSGAGRQRAASFPFYLPSACCAAAPWRAPLSAPP